MRYFATLVSICGLITLSCSDSTGPGDKEPGDTTGGETKDKVQQTVGIAGGIIDNNDIVIDIPAGSFAGSADIVLELIESDEFPDEGLTETYELSGIPLEFSEAFEIRLKYDGTDTGDITPRARRGNTGEKHSGNRDLV